MLLRNFDLLQILYILPGILVAMSFHEFCHAFVANLSGDDTARVMGRLTLDPTKHIDPIGFVAILLAGFGWAKPVPINPNRFKHYRRDYILVALAGPASNLLVAALSFVILYLGVNTFNITHDIFIYVFMYMYIINIAFMIFNLLPIPPLDGYNIAKNVFARVIPHNFFATYERYGQFLLLFIIITGSFSGILGSIILWFKNLLLYSL